MRRLLIPLLLAVCAAPASAAIVQGQVLDQATQQPLAGASVTLYVPFIMGFPSAIATVQTGSDGRYSATVSHSGSLIAIAGAPAHASLTHDGTPCNDRTACYFASTALAVDASTTTVADFSLPHGARLNAQVRDAIGQQSTSSAQLSLIWAGPAAAAHLGYTYYGGSVFQLDNLYPGRYHLKALGWGEGLPAELLLNYVWPDQHCDNVQVSCDSLTPGELVLAPGQQADLTVSMQRGRFLRTRVISDGNGRALYHVSEGHAGANMAYSQYSDDDNLSYLGPLLAGPLFVVLRPSTALDYPAVVYPDRPCNSTPCDFTGAAAVDVPQQPGTYDLTDVHVQPLRSIRGRVTAAASGAPIAGIRVSTGYVSAPVLGAGGYFARATALTDSDGNYRLEGLGADSFILRTEQRGLPWMDQAWQNTQCTSDTLFCNLDTGSYPQLTVSSGQHLTAIDFALQPAARIRGRVVLEATGGPAARYAVLVIPASNARAGKPVYTDENGNFTFGGLDAAGYFLFAAETLSWSGGYGILHPGQACNVSRLFPQPSCDLSAATLLTPPSGGLIDDVVIVIPREDAIFYDGFNSSAAN